MLATTTTWQPVVTIMLMLDNSNSLATSCHDHASLWLFISANHATPENHSYSSSSISK
jgi:hypothetical protein